MKKIFLLVLLCYSCNVQNKTTPQSVSQNKIDTIFLNPEQIKGKVWLEYAFDASSSHRIILRLFINDTVLKYYFADYPSCFEENYRFWERYYDCYKLYDDTLETISKLMNDPKNDNKYFIDKLFSWEHVLYKYKIFIDPYNSNSLNDTILILKKQNSPPEKLHTLTNYKMKYKLKYPILLDEHF